MKEFAVGLIIGVLFELTWPGRIGIVRFGDGWLFFRVLNFGSGICGFGLSIEDRSKHAALFSERNGYIRVLRLGRWSIKPLYPWQ